jgi:hypothetical protein
LRVVCCFCPLLMWTFYKINQKYVITQWFQLFAQFLEASISVLALKWNSCKKLCIKDMPRLFSFWGVTQKLYRIYVWFWQDRWCTNNVIWYKHFAVNTQ